MKIIALIGKNDSGKTTTLKTVIDELIKKGAKIIDNKALHIFGSYISSNSQLPVSSQNEITILLEYNNEIIGITTYGDTDSVLQNKIDIFISIRCTYVICASHPKGSSYTYLSTVATKNNARLIEVAKISCKGDKADYKFDKVCNFADNLAVDEIFLHI